MYYCGCLYEEQPQVPGVDDEQQQQQQQQYSNTQDSSREALCIHACIDNT